MRLLNTQTMQFKQFYDAKVPEYVILSHRWEEAGEVEFADFVNLTVAQRKAVPKVGQFCHLARAHRWPWVWIDTCCIDKRSTVELTEAINSMYRWYKQARRCYVYFNDVKWDRDSPDDGREQLKRSEWFTRGWTLQELLAPRFLECYDKDWKRIGSRDDLINDISTITGISYAHLRDHRSACVAVKMSWAAKRRTSRIEDVAYCLLGLFGICMPMLYGEGWNAFLRLQRKIIKTTDDESIFAWTDKNIFEPYGMLAPSPAAFASSGDVIRATDGAVDRRPYFMTNKGLELHVPDPMSSQSCRQTIIFGLNCQVRSASEERERYLAVKLENIEGRWKRVNCNAQCLRRHVVETSFDDGSSTLSPSVSIYVVQDDTRD